MSRRLGITGRSRVVEAKRYDKCPHCEASAGSPCLNPRYKVVAIHKGRPLLSEEGPLEELRAAKQAAEQAKYDAFEALRVRERAISSQFKDPYGRDSHAYDRSKKDDEECVRLLATFNAARDAFHVAGRHYREAVKEKS